MTKVPTKMVEDLITAVRAHLNENDGDIAILKHPDGKSVVLVGTTKRAAEQIIEAYEALPGPVVHNGQTD